MKWVKVVEVVVAAVADVVVVLAVAADAGRAGWAVLRPPVPVATAFAPVAGTGYRTQWVCLATRRSAPSAARR